MAAYLPKNVLFYFPDFSCQTETAFRAWREQHKQKPSQTQTEFVSASQTFPFLNLYQHNFLFLQNYTRILPFRGNMY